MKTHTELGLTLSMRELAVIGMTLTSYAGAIFGDDSISEDSYGYQIAVEALMLADTLQKAIQTALEAQAAAHTHESKTAVRH